VIGRVARARIAGGSFARLLRALPAVAILALIVASNAPAHVTAARDCGNVRVDRTLKRAPLGIFGAFGINASGTGCGKARRVASGFIHTPSAIDQKGTTIRGYRCRFRVIGPQTARVACSRHHARVRFLDLIPNG